VEGSLDRSGPSWQKGRRIPITAPQFRHMLATREPVVGHYDVDTVPEEYRGSASVIHEMATVPIVLHGEIYAALVVTRRSDEPFAADDVALLGELSPVAGLAMHNARLFVEIDAVRVRAEHLAARLAVGVDAAVELGGELDPRRVIRRLIERAVAAVDADRATFAQLDGETLLVEDSFAGSGEPIAVGTRWNVEDYELLRTAVHQRRAVQTSQGSDLAIPPVVPMVAEHILLVPLLSQGKTVATLGASRVRAERFDDEALAILQQIGSVAVLALRNARLFEARRDFMNMAAHELRTPLTVLHGYLSMLRDGTFGPPSQRWDQPLQVMAGKIDDLSRLVDDLLIGARLERGAARSEPRALDLVGLAVAAVERARPRAALLGGHLELQAGEQAVPVVADPDDVERILDNLLNNALTYSATAPRVVVRVESDVACVRIAVEDHGRGIPAALHERVFEQFFRIDDRKLGYPLGTGLGLYISRQLAEAQGGGLRIARSAPGEGSVFVLELPRPPAVA
jgi:signal transduction histidine kinase